MAEFLWFLAVAGGPLVLGIAFGYALAYRRHLSPREKEARDEATRDLYEKGQ